MRKLLLTLFVLAGAAFAKAPPQQNSPSIPVPHGAVIGGKCAPTQTLLGLDTYGRPLCVNIVGVVNTNSQSKTPSLVITGDGFSTLTFTLNISPGSFGNGSSTSSIIISDASDGKCYLLNTSNTILQDTAVQCTGTAVSSVLLSDSLGNVFSIGTSYGVIQTTASSGSAPLSITVQDALGGTSSLSLQNGTLFVQHIS